MPPCTKRGPYRNGLSIGVEELDWPSQSPDLNHMEHLWDELERRLRARPNRPTSVPNLTNALVAEWKKVPAAMFQHLVESLPRRVEAVIAAKGGPTLYLCLRFWSEMLDEQVFHIYVYLGLKCQT